MPLDPLQDLIARTALNLPEARTLALAGGGAMIAHGRRSISDSSPLTQAVAECVVEVFADGGRLRNRVTLDIGPVLHPDDLAAGKVLALWGRARPRDFYDVRALMDHYNQDQLLNLVASKDATFTLWAGQLSTP